MKRCGSEYERWAISEIVESHIENERDYFIFLNCGD